MDVGLRFLDEQILDRAWAAVFPAGSTSNNTLLHTLATYGSKAIENIPANSHAYSQPLASYPAQFASAFARDSIARQSFSLFLIATLGSNFLYLTISTLSYYLIFDRRLEHHPRFLKNQVRKEIMLSLKVQPPIAALIVPWFVSEIRGHSKMYSNVAEFSGFLGLDKSFPTLTDASLHPWLAACGGVGGLLYLAVSMIAFMVFNDVAIYWIHRWLHIPFLYKQLHKPHHKWLVPTPFAALAFHPLDGYAQSMPYHIFPFMMPLNKYLYIALFVVVNIWTILIHDGDMITGHFLEKFINSPAHHTLHHLYFTCNYGQYFTFSDKMGGSYRAPRPDLDPIHDAIKNMEKKKALALKNEKAEVAPQEIVDDDGDSGYGSENASVADEKSLMKEKEQQQKDTLRRRN